MDWQGNAIEALTTEVAEIRRSLHSVDKTLAEQHVTLVDHVKRTELLERRLDGLWKNALAVIGGLVGIAAGLVTLAAHLGH